MPVHETLKVAIKSRKEKNEPDLLSDSFFLPKFFEISKIRNKTDEKRGQISMRRQFIQQRHKAGVAFSI